MSQILNRFSSPTQSAPKWRSCKEFIQRSAAAMVVIAGMIGSATAQDETVVNQETTKEVKATLAGGCFWCTEAVFERMDGVSDVVSGYTGGDVEKPTYEQICTGRTGHAEAIEIYYDPSKVTFEDLLKVFFKTHDPTTLNQQGADIGTQYRSSIFYHSDQQKKAAEQFIKELGASGEFSDPIVTQLEEATVFYPAEEYHQDYYTRNPQAGYCQAVVRSKVAKFSQSFPEKVKKD